MDEVESLSEATFAFVIIGSLILGVEGLSLAAGKELNPIDLAGSSLQPVKTGFYLLIGLAALHQTYFGYSSFINRIKKTIE
jgi:uncharacterized membrane protein YuzA (DUF378 family)